MKRTTKRTTHVLIFLLVGMLLAAAAGALVAAAAPDVGAMPAAKKVTQSRDPFSVRLRAVPPVAHSTTGPKPPRNVVFKGATVNGGPGGVVSASVAGGPGEVVIPGVPSYQWRDGCGPTAVGMVLGYWDGHGYPDLAPGDVATQNEAALQMIASHGTTDSPRHYEDYSLPDDEILEAPLPDRSEKPAGDEHASDSVADFMHTSWSSEAAQYGCSWTSMVGPAFTGYVQSKYPAASPECTTYGTTASTWDTVKAEIDAGRPMVFGVDSTHDARMDHCVAVMGYREVNGYPEYACWDTWDTTLVRWQQFRAMSTSYGWGVWGVMTFRMDGSTPDPEPTPTPTPTPTSTPTPTADTTPPVTTVSGADDAWHRASVTLILSATDDASGVARTEYAVDGGAWVQGTALTLSPAKKRSGNSGVHSVAYRSVDVAGNVEATQFAVVKLDAVKPVTTSNADGSAHSGSFTLLLTPTDAHSGVAATHYALDGKSYKAGASVQVTGKGTHTVRFYSTDVATNVEVSKSVTITIK